MSRLVGDLSAISGTVSTRGAIVVAGLLAGILTARALGPDGRGQYFTATTLATLMVQLGNLGLSSSNSFLAARDPDRAWALTVNSVWLAVAIGVVTAILVAALGEPASRRFGLPLPTLWLVSVIAPSMLLFILSGSVLAACERFSALNAWHLANALLALALLSVCLALGAGVTGFTAATAIAAAASAGGLVAYLARGRRRSWRFDGALFMAGVHYAGRAYVALLLAYLLQRLGVTLLAWFQEPAEIGQFSVALQIHDVLIIVPGAIGLVLFPRFVREPDRAWASAWGALWVTVATMAGLCALAAAVGGPVIPLLFGASFSPAYAVMLALLPAVLLFSATTVLSQFLVADRYPALLVTAWLVGVLAALAAGIVLIPRHGALGAALAHTVGAAVVFVGTSALARQRVVAARGGASALSQRD